MRLRVLSDVHTEFYADHGRAFVESLDPSGVDVLVLAGDIAVGRGIPDALALFCERFATATVLYVHGNHEFYGSSLHEVNGLTLDAQARWDNLRWLDATEATLDGVRFVGAPLWFRDLPYAEPFKRGMNDFFQIAEFESWVYRENARALALFETVIAPGTVVVSHHLPSWKSVDPRYAHSPLNPFFVCDVEPMILRQAPALWIHGHTHASLDYVLGETRVVCNPFGYAEHEENPRFDPGFTVEVNRP